MTDFATALETLKSAGGAVKDYALAREAGFLPIQRTFEFANHKLTATIMLVSSTGEQRAFASQMPEFIQLAFDHRYVYNKRLDHYMEFACHQREKTSAIKAPITVTVSCGLFRVTPDEFRELWVSEEAAPKHSARHYRLLLSAENATRLCPVPAEPEVTITISSGDQALFTLQAYVDQVLPIGLDDTQDTLVGLTGGDALAASRIRLTHGYNLTSIPGESIVKLGVFLDVPRLSPGVTLDPVLIEFAKSLNGASAEELKQRMVSALKTVATRTEGNLHEHAEMFVQVVEQSDMDPFHLFGSFLHSAWALDQELPVAIAVGHVSGIKTDGAIRVAPNVVVCTQDSHPVRRAIEKEDMRPLCATWPPDGALLVVFYLTPSEPKEFEEKGWDVLRDAFTLLSNVLCDAGWLRTSDSGDPVVFPVDGRLQDASLELSPHYHVQNFFGKYGQQAYARVQKTSHELDLNDFAVAALRPRIDLLDTLIRRLEIKNQHICKHLRRAMEWLAKSRNATTGTEQFLCIWIALEHLWVTKGTANIKDGVACGIARIMGRGDRVVSKWWTRQAKDAYDLRCAIVHEAQEDKEQIERFTPLMRQAAFETIWSCAVSLEADKLAHPSEIAGKLTPLQWGKADVCANAQKSEGTNASPGSENPSPTKGAVELQGARQDEEAE